MSSLQPTIKTIQVQGDLVIKTSDNSNVQIADFNFYNLSIEYEVNPPKGRAIVKSDLFKWHTISSNDISDRNAVHFSFNPFQSNFVVGNIKVTVKGYNGTLLWGEEYAIDNKVLQNLKIEVPLKKPEIFRSADEILILENTKKLYGKVLELSGKCVLKGLTVLLQAKKDGDNLWIIVGSATTDGSGNFSMQYPYGIYVAAEAIVSLTPNSPADIAIKNDSNHIFLKQTIADDFLYLLLQNVECQPKNNEADCNCHDPKKAARLPGYEELLGSDDYTQDIGSSCVNLSIPNRTLNEYTHRAVVRTSDPDVAQYILTKEINKDKIMFNLTRINTILHRKQVDLSNPIYWQDAPDNHDNLSIYQAVEVATGHILHYKVVMKSDGYSMGELLYSLPLAPGQKKEIVVFDQTHILQAKETQQISQRESLTSTLVNDLSIADNLSGRISESISGSSTATTGGASGGFGLGAILDGVGISLGLAGGVANANSSASQNSSKHVAESFAEKLRNSITQNAQGYRELNASVVTTVQEGQKYGVTSEVVANHNHCHSLTMMYFEVLRHYAIYQELSSVEECLFIPLLMTNFTIENIYKWRDVLARNLLPMPSDTYLQPFNEVRSGLSNPVRKAFDALERVRSGWSNVNFPPGAYDEELINFITGEMYIRTNLPRPNSRYDRIKSLPKGVFIEDFSNGIKAYLTFGNDVQLDHYLSIDTNFASVAPKDCIRVINFDDHFFDNDIINRNLWWAYASLLNFTGTDRIIKILEVYFTGKLISEWDGIFYNEIAPVLFEKLIEKLVLVILPDVNSSVSVDFSCDTKYKGGEIIMKVNLRGTVRNKTRKEISGLLVSNLWGSELGSADVVTLILRNLNVRYATAHYNGNLFSGYLNDDLIDLTTIQTPETENERRNPKQEDQFMVNRLIENLNSNFEYYNKILFANLDPDRRFMLLDGFSIQTYNEYGIPPQDGGFRSLASVVKNEVIGIAGNSLVMPVAPGFKIDRSYIVTQTMEGAMEQINLFEHYKPLTPIPSYRISIPTKGVYVEAVMGQCDACEKEKEKTSQEWTKFTTDEPTPINPITTPVPTITDWKAAFKDFAPPVVNIQNAPAAPAPGAGLTELSDLLGKAGIFKDITGLDANQQNAMKTYLSNQENAKAFAEMAKELTMMGHNTEHSDKIMDSIRNSPELSNEQKAALIKDHLQQQIDGGQSKKVEQQNQQNVKPSLTDAAVKAVDQGKAVKASSSDVDGKTETVDISAAPSLENVIAEARDKDKLPLLKQTKQNDCWAVAATIMKSWEAGDTLSVDEVLMQADDGGDKYSKTYNEDNGLLASEKEDFISKLGMVSEPPASYPLKQFITWIQTFGPLWITIDADETEKFSPHAKILFKITGAGTDDGIGTDFMFIDPQTGGVTEPQHYNDFIKEYEQIATDNHSPNLFPQIVHFREVGEGAGGGPRPVPAGWPLGFDTSGYWNEYNESEIKSSKDEGNVFAIFESSIGLRPDPLFKNYYKWVAEVGLIRGSYHFFANPLNETIHPTPSGHSSGGTIEAQVALVVSMVERLAPGDLTPALDIEDQPNSVTGRQPLNDGRRLDDMGYDYRTAAGRTRLLGDVQDFLDRLEQALGRTPLIYTGRMWKDNSSARIAALGNPTALSQYPLFVTDHPSKSWALTILDIKIGGWAGNWDLVQRLPEVIWKSHKIDRDAYNGTIYGLRGLADMGRPAVAFHFSLLGTLIQPYIAYCNSDNSMHYINGPAFNENDLALTGMSGFPGNDPVAVASSDKRTLYYYNRSQESIIEWVLSSDSSITSSLIDRISVLPIHDPRAISDGDKRYVVYWDKNDNWQLVKWDGSWEPTESLLDHAGPLESQGISTGQPVPYLIQGNLHVVGRVGQEGHLFDLTKDSSGSWKSEDISASSVSDDTLHSLLPGATYSPCIIETTDGVFIIFRAVRGELWIINQNTKTATNLFSHLSTSTPLCSGHPTCFVINNIPHIVFRGADKFVYEISPTNGIIMSSIWNTSQISGLIKAAAEPTAATNEEIAIVSFRSVDGAIIVIQYDGTTWTILKQ